MVLSKGSGRGDRQSGFHKTEWGRLQREGFYGNLPVDHCNKENDMKEECLICGLPLKYEKT